MAVAPSRASAIAQPATPRLVAILVYDGVTLLDVAGPAEVFKEANRLGANYQIVLLSPTGEDIVSNLGFGVAVDGAVSSERAPDTYLVPGADRYPRTPVPRALADAARVPAAEARRVASICTGAFILALPDSSQASVRPRIGRSHASSPPDARRAASNPTQSTSVTAARTPRRE